GRLGHASHQVDGARQARISQTALITLFAAMAERPHDARALRRNHGSDRTACSTACKVGRSAPGGTRIVAAPMTISIMGIVPAAGGGSSLPIGRPAVDVVAVGAVMTVVTIGAGVRLTPLSSSRPA